ncbi:YceI family protein [Sulfitobacter sp. D35]|uniref:YceI family protein n=1 Tax=Sulfitobacter sp. D35 TaxID=3083252 RepID=UPI00296EBC92|nr:YceI family protein [Sulfitobacter sp. D35]MDW4497935.1 YceI family protein [Sulfitobacter sp. D35]
MTRHALIAASLALAAGTSALRAEPATWAIDRDHAVIAFTVMHAGYAKVLGRFSDLEGSFTYDPETRELGAVEVRIGAASVDTDHEERDVHVRSGDFLDAEANPDITFVAEGGTPASDTTGTVTGDLTIRGVTQPVTLDVTLNQVADYPCCHGKETIGISATASVLRSDFGSTYALPVFVGDAVDIIIEFEAIRQE